MTDDREIRFQCLELAEREKERGDPRPVLEIAEKIYDWILGEKTLQHRTRARSRNEFLRQEIEPSLALDVPERVDRPRTIKEMVCEVLRKEPTGALTALEILERIHERWLPHLYRTSLSPQLSRLKQEEILKNQAGKWSLKHSGTPTEVGVPES